MGRKLSAKAKKDNERDGVWTPSKKTRRSRWHRRAFRMAVALIVFLLLIATAGLVAVSATNVESSRVLEQDKAALVTKATGGDG